MSASVLYIVVLGSRNEATALARSSWADPSDAANSNRYSTPDDRQLPVSIESMLGGATSPLR